VFSQDPTAYRTETLNPLMTLPRSRRNSTNSPGNPKSCI
jgi:hypothetical protein